MLSTSLITATVKMPIYATQYFYIVQSIILTDEYNEIPEMIPIYIINLDWGSLRTWTSLFPHL